MANQSKFERLLLEMEQQDLVIALACKYIQIKKGNRSRRKHRWWVHAILKNRLQQGAYHNLINELQLDGEKFQQYFRLTREQFAQVLFYVEEHLVKHCRSREVICPRQRLTICLR